jgi:diguanylate cyclase (GGDEF)-like protein/PAS domain S-box-containing protein
MAANGGNQALSSSRDSSIILDSVADAIITVDAEGRIETTNRAARELFEYSPAQFRRLDLEELVGNRSRPQLNRYLDVFLGIRRRSPGADNWFEAEGIRRNRSTFPMELRASAVGLSGGGRTVVVLRDIRERKTYNDALEHFALHDSLTGLANRVLFEDRLTHAVQGSQRSGRPFVVLLCDLDGFKAVNDGFGHAVGDSVLATFGHRLRGVLRESDTVARIGGDEFAIIPHGAEEAGDGTRTASGILKALESPILVDDAEITVGASIGIACYPADGDRQTIVRKADLAMYAAKRTGTHCTVYASELEGLLKDRRSPIRAARPRMPSAAQAHRQQPSSRPGPAPEGSPEPQNEAQ